MPSPWPVLVVLSLAWGIAHAASGLTHDRLRLLWLAAMSLAILFVCFLPALAQHLGSHAPLRVASYVFLPIALSGLVGQLWISRRGVPAGTSPIFALVLFIAQITSVTLLLVVAFGNAAPRESGFYLGSVLLALFNASILFLRLLCTSFRDESDTQEPRAYEGGSE